MKTRLRTLRVDDRDYVWTAAIGHVRSERDCYRTIRLRVWGSGRNSRVLEVDLLSTSPPGPWGACATDTAHPTPRDVRAVVEYAREHGWDQEAVGGTYLLTEHQHASAFALSDFLLTDRLRDPDAMDPSARLAETWPRASGT